MDLAQSLHSWWQVHVCWRNSRTRNLGLASYFFKVTQLVSVTPRTSASQPRAPSAPKGQLESVYFGEDYICGMKMRRERHIAKGLITIARSPGTTLFCWSQMVCFLAPGEYYARRPELIQAVPSVGVQNISIQLMPGETRKKLCFCHSFPQRNDYGRDDLWVS